MPRPDRFTDRVVLITGAGSGIGASMAAGFAAEGAQVVIADINGAAAESTATGIDGSRAAVLDVTNRQQVDELVKSIGPIDVLVNNAAVAGDRPFHEVSAADWDRDVDVTLKGTFNLTQAVLPSMRGRGGVILNISSVNALSYFGNEAYSAAKAAVLSLTRSIAVRYGAEGIRCNALAPGTIATPIWDERIAQDPDVLTKAARWYPLGRVGTTRDVTSAALFLCSDEASWITGICLPVDGGVTAGNYQLATEISIADGS